MLTASPLQFDLLTLQDVVAACRQRGIEDYRGVAAAFGVWQRTFARKAQRFYQTQYDQHYQSVWERFCRQHRLLPGDTLPDWLDEAWEVQRVEEGLTDHRRLVEDQRATLERYELHYLSDAFAASPLNHLPLDFDALWFNRIIRNTPQTQDELHKLPYEIYLTTRHWQKVRAALLLIYQATCQGEGCRAGGESWYGDESALEVHHLRYTTLGCERFGDVTLLCRDCHRVAHTK